MRITFSKCRNRSKVYLTVEQGTPTFSLSQSTLPYQPLQESQQANDSWMLGATKSHWTTSWHLVSSKRVMMSAMNKWNSYLTTFWRTWIVLTRPSTLLLPKLTSIRTTSSSLQTPSPHLWESLINSSTYLTTHRKPIQNRNLPITVRHVPHRGTKIGKSKMFSSHQSLSHMKSQHTSRWRSSTRETPQCTLRI